MIWNVNSWLYLEFLSLNCSPYEGDLGQTMLGVLFHAGKQAN